MTDSFTKKRLELTINIGGGVNGDDIVSTSILTGIRMTADIAFAGGVTTGACQIQAWGLTQSRMNELTTIGPVATELFGKNSVQVRAGDDDSAMSLAFEGSIMEAFGNYAAMPSTLLYINAAAGMVQALKPVPPTSFSAESADVSVIMSGLANIMGLNFMDLGVDVKLSRPYFDGTALMQARACARAADIWMTIDRGSLIIWPKDGLKGIGDIPLISPATGLVGYPIVSSNQIQFTSIYNPNIQFPGNVQLESSLPMAQGKFGVNSMSHSLSSGMPNGPWFTTVNCYKNGQ